MYQPSARDITRITCYLLILFALLIAALIVFLSQLDLNDYRASLENSLSSVLEQPVKIGRSTLTFNHGIAISFEDLQIGADEKPTATVPHVTATLKIPPLFKGEFVLAQIHVENPQVQLWLPLPQSKNRGGSRQLLANLGVNILTIDGGTFTIQQKNKKHPPFRISNLYAVLEGWHPGQVGRLNISGNLDSYGAGLVFETQLPGTRGETLWRGETFDTRLAVTDFSTASLVSPQVKGFPQHVTLNLALSGSPATGAVLRANLVESVKKKNLLELSARWISTPDQESITKIGGTILEVPLAGEIYLLRQDKKSFLGGKLVTNNITITPELLKAWYVSGAEKLTAGTLEKFTLTLKDNWKADGNPFDNLQLNGGLALSHLAWKQAGPTPLQKLAFDFSLKNKTLALSGGTFVAAEQPVAFSGEINSIFHQPQINMNFSLNPLLEEFSPRFNLPAGWKLSGHIPTRLTLTGALIQPRVNLDANLDAVTAKLGNFFNKGAADRAKLSIRGNLKKNGVQLNRATLTLGQLTLAASGQLETVAGEKKYRFATTPFDLGELKPFSPLLTKLNVQGKLSGKISQQQTGLQGALDLDRVGAHLTSVIGELNNTSGQIELDHHGLTFQNLHASLGKSPFILTGVLSNWQEPLLSLDLKGDKIRAHDLIFSNRQLTLYDLNGHLNIDKNGLEFAPVKVRLEEETLATVTGDVSFNHPEVVLDIRAEKANVIDVINLFSEPEKIRQSPVPHHRVPVRIEAFAKTGTLGGLHFKNAHALILSDAKHLTIFPLNFASGDGWCRARILFDYDNNSTPLKISGHAENLDATVLHQNLFERKGLVSGQLSSDFYLEGNPAHDHFWQTAKGGIHARISNGVLRKFHGLAKVFSLLNVSQLFSGKLPDIDKEGMPFTLAEGSIQVAAGRATTNDLKIDSPAMNLSVVGSTNLVDDTLDLNLGVMPLGTVDKIITSIPIAGWVLAGKKEALVTAHFKIEGSSEKPIVTAVPIDSVSDTVVGIVKRTFGLPGKVVKDIGTIFKKKPEKKKTE